MPTAVTCGGESLTQAISKHPRVFSTTYCEVMKAGEQSGDLETELFHMADYLESQEELKRRIRRAVTYPVLIVMMAIGVGALLTTVVLPPLVALFESLETTLPLSTRLALAGIGFIVNYKFFILAFLLALPVTFAFYVRLPSGRYNVDRFLLHLPLVGQIILKANLTNFCRTSAMLLAAGLQISKVLGISCRTVSNTNVRAALKTAETNLMAGQPFSQAVASLGVFPESSIESLVVGEKTGELDASLKNIADNFERKNNQKVEELISLLEPGLTIVIGLGVAFIAISIISPIYSISQGLQ